MELTGKRKFGICLFVLVASGILRYLDKLTGAELVSLWSLTVTTFMGSNALQAIGVAIAAKETK